MTTSLSSIWTIASTSIRHHLQRKAVVILLIASWAPTIVLGIAMFSIGEYVQANASAKEISRIPDPPILPIGIHKMVAQLFGRPGIEEIFSRDNPRGVQYLVDCLPLIWDLFFYQLGQLQLIFIFCVLLMIGPYLVVPDLRSRSLSLYFSRPVSVLDYTAAKVGVLSFFLFMVFMLPCIVLYLFSIIMLPNADIIKLTYTIPFRLIGYFGIMALFLSMTTIGITSLTNNIKLASLSIIIVFFGSYVMHLFLRYFTGEQPHLSGPNAYTDYVSISNYLSSIMVIFLGINDHLPVLNKILKTEQSLSGPFGGKFGPMDHFGYRIPIGAALLFLALSFSVMAGVYLRRIRNSLR